MKEKKKHLKAKLITKIDNIHCEKCTNIEECTQHFKNKGVIEFTGRTENCVYYNSEQEYKLAIEQEAEDAKALDYEDEDLQDEEEDEEKEEPYEKVIDENRIPV